MNGDVVSEGDPNIMGKLADVWYIIVAFFGVNGWLGWQVKRNAAKADESVPRSEFNNTVDALRTEIKSTHRDVVEEIRGTNQRLDKLMLFLADKTSEHRE